MDNQKGKKRAEVLNKIKNARVIEKCLRLKSKCKEVFAALILFVKNKEAGLKKIKWSQLPTNIWKGFKKIKFKKTGAYKWSAKVLKKVSDSWKMLLVAVPSFLFFYYALGCFIVENIDVQTQYKLEKDEKVPLFKTSDAMAFLIKREVDDKMWTPNLPMIFPAYVLDNMPNFQTGIVAAVKDTAGTLRYFRHNTDAQNKDIKEAYKLLSYAPDVWIMSRKGKFNLAPSSNSQYRKAANELRKFTRDGIYKPNTEDLALILKKFSSKLQKLTLESEDYQQENAFNWLDGKADDVFYLHKGYAFALWQIGKVLCYDYKKIIVEHNLYEDWIRMSKSLQRAAEYAPLIIRGGKPDSIFTPNHLIMQNYYLLRAMSAVLKISNNLAESANAD